MRTAVIDGGGEVLCGPEAEGAMTDKFDLVIHAFEGSIRDPQSGPSQDAVKMSTQPPHQLLEGLQPRAHGGMHPALQMLFGSGRLAVIPEELKNFFEVIGPHDGRIPAH